MSLEPPMLNTIYKVEKIVLLQYGSISFNYLRYNYYYYHYHQHHCNHYHYHHHNHQHHHHKHEHDNKKLLKLNFIFHFTCKFSSIRLGVTLLGITMIPRCIIARSAIYMKEWQKDCGELVQHFKFSSWNYWNWASEKKNIPH